MRSAEEQLLRPTNELVSRAAAELFPNATQEDARLCVLEAVAGAHAGWQVEELWALSAGAQPAADSDPGPWAEKVLASLGETEIPAPLALAALSREVLSPIEQRKSGAYYTDWRLAKMLAESSVPQVRGDGPWIDPACGSGVLLVAATMAASPRDREELVRARLCAADLSGRALRGTRLAIGSLVRDLGALKAFQGRLVRGDSLRSQTAWRDLAPNGFALVIGNPPWERLRTSRHETASASGHARHYGQSFNSGVDLTGARSEILDYLSEVVNGTRLQGKGDHDLYKLFLELGLGLAAEDGIIAQLVPAGLIRSQGTESLRGALAALTSDLSIFVLENRQRHFAIDSRFKFLAVIGRVGAGQRDPIAIRVANRTGRLPATPVRIDRSELKRVRSDLTIPEVRTDEEWQLFARLSNDGIKLGRVDGPWRPRYFREIDMTSDRKSFQRHRTAGALPVIEGRHVAQFRNRAKIYRSGEGRAAIWEPVPLGSACLRPQWFIGSDRLRTGARSTSQLSRIGFCDITGQTNERSLLVARIPAGVVCGNKVPTLRFPEGGRDREDLFVGLANSLVVDWMLRRLVTTTVNFFLLNSVPLPPITEGHDHGAQIVELSRQVAAAEGGGEVDLWKVAQWRAKIDALAAASWGVGIDEMRLVLDDFPLLDRGQPALPGEERSSITGDLLISTLADLLGETADMELHRVQKARDSGAIAYVPAEYARKAAR